MISSSFVHLIDCLWFEKDNNNAKFDRFAMVVLRLFKWKTELLKKLYNFQSVEDINLVLKHSGGIQKKFYYDHAHFNFY